MILSRWSATHAAAPADASAPPAFRRHPITLERASMTVRR
jgi:hypothetical protein